MSTASFTIDAATFGVVEQPAGQFSAANRGTSSSEAYDALENRGKRKRPPPRVIREDSHFVGKKRTQLIANANDVAKNFSIACWAIRRHLDYVTQFDFQAQTPDREFNKQLERVIQEASKRKNFDRGGRLTLKKAFRLLEARRVLDNDIGLMRLRDRSVQIIEADLIKNPPTPAERAGTENVEGVRKDYAGWPLGYHIWGRDAGGITTSYRREVPASNFALYGFFDRSASDQVRGVSPFVTAINPLRDTYDTVDLATAKMKLGEIMGIAVFQKQTNGTIGNSMPGNGSDDESCEDGESDDEENKELDVSGGVKVWQFDENEDAKILESNTPSTEVQAFLQTLIAIALKALDIPYSFFDESFTNYSGSRGSWLHYERACTDKRDDQIEVRETWTDWTLQSLVADGLLELPRGWTVGELEYGWIPRGMPWWKPSEEVVGDLKAIGGALDNPERICRERDRGDVYDNIDATIRVMKYAHEQGIKELGRPLNLSFEGEFPQVIEVSANGN